MAGCPVEPDHNTIAKVVSADEWHLRQKPGYEIIAQVRYSVSTPEGIMVYCLWYEDARSRIPYTERSGVSGFTVSIVKDLYVISHI